MPFETSADTLIPQANSLAVIVSVVDAIADGCDTATTIADAIGMSGRQGAYYPHAAATLGLVEAVAGTLPLEWQLTERGALFVGLDAPERVEALCDALAELAFLEVFVDEGATGLCETWADKTTLSEETIARRAATIDAWARFLFDTARAEQERAVQEAMTGTRERAPGVRAAARHGDGRRDTLPRCGTCNAQVAITVTECEICGAAVR